MKVILNKKIEKLGEAHESVEVKDGYARNFLFPKKLAVKWNLKLENNLKKHTEVKRVKEQESLKEIENILNSKTKLVVNAKVGKDNQLFGSIRPKNISDAINEKYNVKINTKSIHLKDTIKKAGEYTAEIKLNGKTSQLPFIVK